MPASLYYAVIFTNQRTVADATGYEQMATRMVELAAQQPGFLGIESTRDENGVGITISYWESLDAIRQWREHTEHRIAQRLGREKWYEWFRLRIARIESEYEFKRPQ